MAIIKNTASQGLYVYAHDTAADAAKTGDAANITAKLSLDGAAYADTDDTNPTEIGRGVYWFALTQAETNAGALALMPVSATGDVVLDPVLVLTQEAVITYQTGDAYARLGAPAGASVSADIADLPTNSELGTALSGLNDITVADIIAGISEGSLDLQEMLRIIVAAVAGKASGGGTATIKFRDLADTKDRITATVDVNGNRSVVTVDGS